VFCIVFFSRFLCGGSSDFLNELMYCQSSPVGG
jgi:hypothetical protein